MSTQPAGNRRELIQTTRQRALQAGDAILTAIKDEMTGGQHTYLETNLALYYYHVDVVAVADAALALLARNEPPPVGEPSAHPAVPTYEVSSWFLADCAAYLLSHPDGYELLHLVTGSKISPTQRTLERLIQVPLDAHSPVNARANQHELQQLLIELSRWGHTLHGLFHSHPGYGKEATQPSKDDRDTQQLYEQGGYPLVSAIFSRDGYVRFFATNPVTISVFGAGVAQHEAHIFKIQTLERHLPVHTPQNTQGGAGVSRR